MTNLKQIKYWMILLEIILASNIFVWNSSYIVYIGNVSDFWSPSISFWGSAITNAEAMQIWRYGTLCWMGRMGWINTNIYAAGSTTGASEETAQLQKQNRFVKFKASNSD